MKLKDKNHFFFVKITFSVHYALLWIEISRNNSYLRRNLKRQNKLRDQIKKYEKGLN